LGDTFDAARARLREIILMQSSALATSASYSAETQA